MLDYISAVEHSGGKAEPVKLVLDAITTGVSITIPTKLITGLRVIEAPSMFGPFVQAQFAKYIKDGIPIILSKDKDRNTIASVITLSVTLSGKLPVILNFNLAALEKRVSFRYFEALMVHEDQHLRDLVERENFRQSLSWLARRLEESGCDERCLKLPEKETLRNKYLEIQSSWTEIRANRAVFRYAIDLPPEGLPPDYDYFDTRMKLIEALKELEKGDWMDDLGALRVLVANALNHLNSDGIPEVYRRPGLENELNLFLQNWSQLKARVEALIGQMKKISSLREPMNGNEN